MPPSTLAIAIGFMPPPPTSHTRRSPWLGRSRRAVMPEQRKAASRKDLSQVRLNLLLTANESAATATTTTAMNTDASQNNAVLSLGPWLERVCPQELLPKILALAGPHTTQALSTTNKHWKHLLDQESTWKVLCTDLYKVCTEERLICSVVE